MPELLHIIVYICLALYALFLGVAGVALWQGKGEQRGSTIQAAFAVFVYSVIGFCTDGNIIGLIYALSFSGPIILVLTGKSNRWRTWLAIAIYVIGCLGVPFVATLQESTATDHYNQGVKYQQQGQLDLAIKEYTQAIEIDPKLPQAYLNRGNAYIAQGDYDRAIADCHKAIALNPKFAEAYHNRGLAYALKGDYAFALIDLDTAIALDPKNAEAYYLRGLVYTDKGEQQKAINDLEKALNLGLKPDAKQQAEATLEKLKR